jgi:hypothetical protein
MRIVRMSRGYLCFQRDGNSFTSLAMPEMNEYPVPRGFEVA